MKRLILAALFLSACGSGGTNVTAAPALEEAPQDVDIAAFAPAAIVGTGVITFGVALDPETSKVTNALARFKSTYRDMAWSASLTRPVDDSSVIWVVASQVDSGGEEARFSVEEPTDPGARILANSGDLAVLVDNEPGTYVMRYLDGREVLAEGRFTLVK